MSRSFHHVFVIHRRLICLILSFAAFLYFIFLMFQFPYAGIHVKSSDGRVLVESSDHLGWTGSRLQEGDRLLSVDGQAAADRGQESGNGEIRHAQHLEWLHNGERQTLSFSPADSPEGLIIHFLFPVLFFALCLVLAAFMLARGQGAGVSVLIIFLSLIGPVFTAISAASGLRENGPVHLFILFSFLISPTLMLHYLNQYGQSRHLHLFSDRYLLIQYVLSAAAFIVAAVLMPAGHPLSVVLTAGAALFLFLLVPLFYQLFTAETKASRILLQVPAAGVTAALLPFVIFYGLPALLLKQEVITWQWTMPFLSLIPLTWFYLSVSDRFIDVSFVTGRLVYCGTIGAGAAVLVSGVFSMMAQNGSAYGSMDWIRLAFAVWTIVTMTLYLKEFLDYSLRKRLYPKRQDYQTSLNRFLQWMKMDPDTSGLGKILKKEIEACLPFENVRLIREGLTGEKSPVIDGNRVSLFTEPDRKIAFSKKGFSALLSAGHSEDITLAGSWSGPRTRLNPDERSWLATLISYAQIATENLKNTKELLAELRQPVREGRALPITVKKMMVRISEQERKELAKDLHDHNLQDQLAFARDMDSWREWTQDRKLGHFLGYIREQVLDSVYILRQVIYEIHPEFIYRAGLKKSLDELFEKVNLRGDFVLETFIDDRTAMLPKEFEMTVYRVVQELLNNAMKHAGAKRVTLRLSKEGNEFGLYYEDDGVGMDVSKVGQSFGTMGFPGMIGRVEGIGGRIVIRSQKGKGLSVKIRWPAD